MQNSKRTVIPMIPRDKTLLGTVLVAATICVIALSLHRVWDSRANRFAVNYGSELLSVKFVLTAALELMKAQTNVSLDTLRTFFENSGNDPNLVNQVIVRDPALWIESTNQATIVIIGRRNVQNRDGTFGRYVGNLYGKVLWVSEADVGQNVTGPNAIPTGL